MKFRPALPFVLLCLCVAGCARKEATIKLGFLVKQPEEPWFQYEWKGAEKAAAQYHFDLVKLGVPDAEKVITAIDNLSAQRASGFVICTPDVRLGTAIVNKSKVSGLKVITVDDQFLGADGKAMTDVPYLGMSATKIGNQVGDALAVEIKRRKLPLEETGLCVVTFDQLETIHQRTEGAVSALVASGFPSDHVFRAAQKTLDLPGSFDAANILLTQHPEIKRWLVCGGNDTAVLGAIRATEGRGFTTENVIGIGINGTDCIDELRKPKPTGFYGSMFVSASDEGFHTTEMLYHWVKDGTPPPPDTRTVGQLITRDNFEAVLKDAGIIQ